MRSLIVTFFILLPLSSWALKCGIEHKKFCSHAENGKPELITCLTKHDSKLGLRCRSSLAALKKKQKQNPCFDDIGKHCSDIPANGHALMICLLKHETKLSKSCASDVAKKKDSFTSKDPCAQDLMNKCYSELAQGEGYSLRCLFKNKGKLMARCETHIATTMQNNEIINRKSSYQYFKKNYFTNNIIEYYQKKHDKMLKIVMPKRQHRSKDRYVKYLDNIKSMES